MNHCDWCGEAISEDDRFCPATDCQMQYMRECKEHGEPIADAEVNDLWRARGWM